MRVIGLIILMSAGAFAADSPELSQAQFDKARENYTYHQTARIQELEPSGTVSGRWETVSDIVFDGGGKRSEKVVRAPVASLKNILLTPEDMEDLKSVQPFVLTTTELPKYLIRYLGKETLDEIPCYA